jgi:hypothetical protein
MHFDFTSFLKYIPDAPIDWQPPVGEGWRSIVHVILRDIDNELPAPLKASFVVTQIKEKFGSLRFSYRFGNDVSDELRERISEIVIPHLRRADTSCELCGATGRIGGYFSGYYQALCPFHALSRMKSDRSQPAPWKTWQARLRGGSLQIIGQGGGSLSTPDLDGLEQRLADDPTARTELFALRDARFVAGI